MNQQLFLEGQPWLTPYTVDHTPDSSHNKRRRLEPIQCNASFHMSIRQQGNCQEQLKRGPHASDAIFIPLRTATNASVVQFAITAEVIQQPAATAYGRTAVVIAVNNKRFQIRLAYLKKVQ
jgi:hypothetical protein